MRFSCLKENLSTALALVEGLSGKAAHLPVLGHVLLTADQQKVEISSTNLEIAITAVVRAKVEQTGTLTTPAHTLGDVVRLFSGDKLSLEQAGGELVLSGASTNTRLKTGPAEDFPVIPVLSGGQGYLVAATDLVGGVRATLSAAAKNDVRPELAGIMFAFSTSPPHLTLAATDSYRLAEYSLPLTSSAGDFKAIVPAHTAQEIQRVLALLGKSEAETDVRLLLNEHQLLLSFQNIRLTSRLVAGEFPDYQQIIPAQFNTTIKISASQLVNEVKAAGLFTTSGVNAITLSCQPESGEVSISAAAAQTGEYRSTLPATVTGAPLSVLLNHHYLLDGLAHLATPQAVLKFVDAESPGLLLPTGDQPNYRYLVMPIRQ